MDSILDQSFSDWEILLIDDGSSDGSDKLCDKYALSPLNIQAFHQKNGGISVARNVGLSHARGEYITFIDADDILLDRDYLLLLHDAVVEQQSEMSMCGIAVFSDGEAPPLPSGNKKVMRILSGEEAFYPNAFPPNFYLDASPGKLFRQTLFKSLRYPVGRNMEDSYVMHHILYPCKKIALIDSNMYGYRVHDSSIFHATSAKDLSQDLVYGLQDRIQYFESLGRLDLAHFAEQKLLHAIMNQDILNKMKNEKR